MPSNARNRVGNKKRGFTFLEIMLVVMILGLLAALVSPNIGNKAEQSRRQTTRINIAAVSQALKAYELDRGSPPSSSQGLRALIEPPRDAGESSWNGPYLDAETLPVDAWGREFRYRCPPERGTRFDLWSVGRDGADGTADDIGNWPDAKK
jgi:general secretion pathway protein G